MEKTMQKELGQKSERRRLQRQKESDIRPLLGKKFGDFDQNWWKNQFRDGEQDTGNRFCSGGLGEKLRRAIAEGNGPRARDHSHRAPRVANLILTKNGFYQNLVQK